MEGGGVWHVCAVATQETINGVVGTGLAFAKVALMMSEERSVVRVSYLLF